jgi:hypothetical protein
MNIPSNFTKVITLLDGTYSGASSPLVSNGSTVNLKKQSLPVQGGELGFTAGGTFVSTVSAIGSGGSAVVKIEGNLSSDFSTGTFTLATLTAQTAASTQMGSFAAPLPPFIRAVVTNTDAGNDPTVTLVVKAIVGGR